jgi:hypothetical protein
MPDTAVSRKRQILGRRAYYQPLLGRHQRMMRNLMAA